MKFHLKKSFVSDIQIDTDFFFFFFASFDRIKKAHLVRLCSFLWEFLVDEVITEELLSQMFLIVKHLTCGRISSGTYRKVVLLECWCSRTTSVH